MKKQWLSPQSKHCFFIFLCHNFTLALLISILHFSSNMMWLWRIILYVSDLGCYLPGRTFSIISPSVGAECSCLVSLRAKNHIWRTQFRRVHRGGSTGHMSELHRHPTRAHTNTDTNKTRYMASKQHKIQVLSRMRSFWLITKYQITASCLKPTQVASPRNSAFCAEPKINEWHGREFLLY